MAIDKSKFASLAQLFGYQINEDAIQVVANEYDMDYPDNWDEMSEEEQAAWKAEHEVKGNTQEPAKPTQVPAQRSRPARVQKNETQADFQNLLNLNQLIDDIGGFEAYKGLLLNAVEAVEQLQQNQNQERDALISVITANSSSFKAEDLQDMDVPILQKLAEGLSANSMRSNVDYSLLNTRGLKRNAAEEDIAAPPAFLLANEKKEA